MDNAKIIAVDFDGTLVENKWPEIGAPIEKNIAKVKAEQEAGAKIILWTNRVGEPLEKALAFVRRRASISMRSIRIFPKLSKHLGLTAGRSSPMNIGMIAQCLCPRRISENSLTGSTLSIPSIISGSSSSQPW